MSQTRRRAILIAASEFPDEPLLTRLRCPKNDVEGLAEVLTSSEFGLFDDPQLLVNQPHHTTQRAINRIFTQAGRDDQILIYYSGHGKQDAAGHLHLTMTDTEANALEASSLAVGMLCRLIDNHACKQVALILDCCFSGAVGKDFLKGDVDDHLKQTFRDRGIYILTASTATQAACEKEGEHYSLFTKHLLHGIRQAEADLDDDGWVSIGDLYEYIKKHVPKEAPQHPTKWEFGIQGNELVIARAAQMYSAKQLQLFEEKIIEIRKFIPSSIFKQAYDVINENQPKRDKAQLKLLKALCDDALTIGKYIEEWLKLVAPVAPRPEPKAPRMQSPTKSGSSERARAAEQAKLFSEDLNGVPLEMILVPGGTFKMGSEKYDSEKPPHDVTVLAFYIGKYQITQAQWRAVMGDQLKPNFKGDDLPMESISWEDAKEFCKKLSAMMKKEYRLPTEAEWEYACRAGTTGDYAGDLDAMAWYDKNSAQKTHPVGQKQPNDFGLYDMHGNVWEWCEDVMHKNYKDAPGDGSAWLSGGDSTFRVMRGGSWDLIQVDCRSADRFYDRPALRFLIGVRVVVSARALTP